MVKIIVAKFESEVSIKKYKQMLFISKERKEN